MKNIDDVLKGLVPEDLYDKYGKYFAKLDLRIIDYLKNKGNGKLILVTAMTPTPAGEGKTTTAIGLGNALKILGKNAGIAIREPSLGPCFGVKGGATGGGRSTVEPSDKINLMFTGDFPAVSAAHNLLSAMINNHIYHGNNLKLDPKNITFPRTIDMDDRSLRNVIVGAGDKNTGVMMGDRYVITAASEIMAILALSRDYKELKHRLGNIMIGYNNKKPVFARDINAHGAMSALLVDALRPNIAQTSENVPAIIHTGPFGNIAHGTSSILGDIIGLKMFDYLVTEAGFGSDLGFEKFIDIVLRLSNLRLSAVVIVATIRAMRYHGGGKINEPNPEAVIKGSENLLWHVENVRKFGFDPVVAINRHSNDSDDEINAVSNILTKNSIDFAVSDAYKQGGSGTVELAEKVLKHINEHESKFIYEINDDPEEKILKIAMKVYGAKEVEFSDLARHAIKLINDNNFNNFYVCMAKTQSSISDNPRLLNVPRNFNIKINDIIINSGSGFIIPMLGNIMTMPGLPRRPAAENIDIDDYGNIKGLQ